MLVTSVNLRARESRSLCMGQLLATLQPPASAAVGSLGWAAGNHHQEADACAHCVLQVELSLGTGSAFRMAGHSARVAMPVILGWPIWLGAASVDTWSCSGTAFRGFRE